MDVADLDRAAQGTAAGQGGVLTRRQALALGASPAQVATALRSGRWTAVATGAYLPAPALPEGSGERWLLRCAAAVVLRAPRSVVCGPGAALVHGLPLLGRAPASVRTRRDLPAEDVTRLHGVAVTTLIRTAVDVARCGTVLGGVVTLDAALARGLSRTALESAVPPAGPGRLAALRAVALADGRSGSPLESLGRVRMLQGGLPPAELQVDLGGADRAVVVDHLWREWRTVAEADGALKYRTPADLWAEKRREDRLRDAGWEVVRYTWDEALHHPSRLVERVQRAFARARGRRAA